MVSHNGLGKRVIFSSVSVTERPDNGYHFYDVGIFDLINIIWLVAIITSPIFLLSHG